MDRQHIFLSYYSHIYQVIYTLKNQAIASPKKLIKLFNLTAGIVEIVRLHRPIDRQILIWNHRHLDDLAIFHILESLG